MNVVVTGSIAYDYLMRFPGYFQEHILPDRLDGLSLSFLVESMTRRRGGTGPNIAYTMALLGGRPRLFATAGEDFEEYRAWLEARGVDTSLVRIVPNEFTASFFVNTDRANAQIASFYPGAMAYAAELSFKGWEGKLPDLVVISPNDPAAMIRYTEECRELNIPFLFDPSQQIVRFDSHQLSVGLESAAALFVNDYEFSLIAKKTGLTPDALQARVGFFVVTDGERGARIYADGDMHLVEAVLPERLADPTGVGDAFRGGFLTGYTRGWDWTLCGRMGALAATYCLEESGPQGMAYTPEQFILRYRQHFDDDGRLDLLMK